MKNIVLIVVVLLLTPVVVSAFNGAGVEIDNRINYIQVELDNKLRNGQLSHHKASLINIALNKVRDSKAKAVATRRLTPSKVIRLNPSLDKIEQQLHRHRRPPIRR